MLERPRSRDQQIQALVGSHPDGTPGGSRQGSHTIVYERVRALRIVLQMFDVPRERVNDVDSGISGAGPDAACVIDEPDELLWGRGEPAPSGALVLQFYFAGLPVYSSLHCNCLFLGESRDLVQSQYQHFPNQARWKTQATTLL